MTKPCVVAQIWRRERFEIELGTWWGGRVVGETRVVRSRDAVWVGGSVAEAVGGWAGRVGGVVWCGVVWCGVVWGGFDRTRRWRWRWGRGWGWV